MRGKPYFRGLTKSALKTEIRAIIAGYQFDEIFTSELISDLIVEKHWYCSVHGLRPDVFRKQYKHGTPYDFAGRFNGRWNLVSWMHCIDAQTDEDRIIRALRDAARPFVADYKRQHPTCEVCGVNPTVEADHVAPEFSEIAAQAMAALNPELIAEYLKATDWWSPDPFRLPDDSPAYRVVRDMHCAGTLQAVCKQCHINNAANRRAVKRGDPCR